MKEFKICQYYLWHSPFSEYCLLCSLIFLPFAFQIRNCASSQIHSLWHIWEGKRELPILDHYHLLTMGRRENWEVLIPKNNLT